MKYHAMNDYGIVLCGQRKGLSINWRDFLKRLQSERCKTCEKCLNDGNFPHTDRGGAHEIGGNT